MQIGLVVPLTGDTPHDILFSLEGILFIGRA